MIKSRVKPAFSKPLKDVHMATCGTITWRRFAMSASVSFFVISLDSWRACSESYLHVDAVVTKLWVSRLKIIQSEYVGCSLCLQLACNSFVIVHLRASHLATYIRIICTSHLCARICHYNLKHEHATVWHDLWLQRFFCYMFHRHLHCELLTKFTIWQYASARQRQERHSTQSSSSGKERATLAVVKPIEYMPRTQAEKKDALSRIYVPYAVHIFWRWYVEMRATWCKACVHFDTLYFNSMCWCSIYYIFLL